MGAVVAVALVLTVGTVYGMTGWSTPQQGAYSNGPNGGSYPYWSGMMGGYRGYGGYGGMMGGYGGMMGGYGYGGVPPAGPSNYWRGTMGGYSGMMGGYWNGSGPNGSSYPYWGMMGGYAWNGTHGAYVSIFRNGFYPAALTISRGTTVTWVNMDFVQHTVTSGSEQAQTNLFDSHALSNGQSFSYTFDTPGTYTYYCDVHPHMVGAVTVRA